MNDNNAFFGNGNPAGGGSAGNATGPQPPLNQPQPPRPHGAKFFNWIRSSYVVRPDHRVIAGVAAGIARQIGWSTVLVRVLFAVSVLFGGFGALLYALGWLLLPDESSGVILAEDTVNDRWDWSMLGVILCVVIAAGSGWYGGWIVALALAALLLFLLVDNGRRRWKGTIHPPYASPDSGPGPSATAPTANMTGHDAPNSFVPPATAHAQPYAQTPYGQSPYTQAPYGQSPYAQNPYAPQPPYADVPPYVAPQYAASPVAPVVPRRRPAGPALVLAVTAIGFFATALLGFVLGHVGNVEFDVMAAAVWTVVLGLVVGVMLIVIGIRGRRAGGLIPYAILSMALSVLMVITCTSYSVIRHSGLPMFTNSTASVVVDGKRTLAVTGNDFARLRRGVVVSGSDYDADVLNIDLTGSSVATSHDVMLNNGKTATSTCPAGTLRLSAVESQVLVTIPDGCSFRIGEYAFESGDVTSSVGGDNLILGFGGALDFSLDTDTGTANFGYASDRRSGVYVAGTNAGIDCSGVGADESYEFNGKNANYWPCFADADNAPEPELVIAAALLSDAKVTVQYQSTGTNTTGWPQATLNWRRS
ncbi:PspC domain-containing protein [Bifidobacterium choloepi]|uniref:PspC domain-containing protein n=1 Tax=Bifidobacterium choloepi TaxID=2614131 RepID=A0A6I5N0F6_9BIFI|nr:PspC domain-containing protein [Bifidobacterium choloepi]NEG69605.1 PspC domain-containing protein [Bifidobacterium choloepi]